MIALARSSLKLITARPVSCEERMNSGECHLRPVTMSRDCEYTCGRCTRKAATDLEPAVAAGEPSRCPAADVCSGLILVDRVKCVKNEMMHAAASFYPK